MKREFTGAFIPAKIWLDESMTPAEKMLLGEIKALSENTGWCNANNAHFAKWLHCTPQNVSMYISRLSKNGYVQLKYEDERSYSGRRMRVNLEWYHGVNPLSQTEGALSQTEGPLSQTETEIQSKYNLNISSSLAENQTSPLDTFEHSTQDINGGGPAAAQLDNWLSRLNNPKTRESFQMVHRIPAANFDPYLKAFEIDIKGREETYYNYTRLASHFLNWCERRHRIESKPAPQPVNRFNQPEPAPAYKPPKPIEEMPEPKYRSR
jgi:hypothetical protein